MAKWNNAAKKWSTAMQSASTAYSEGIDSVTVNPMERAAQNEQGYINGVQQAVASGKWARNLRKVSLTDWKSNAKQKGAGRLAAGAKQAEGKVQQFWQRFGPIQEQVRAQVLAMPNTTFAERMARMNAMAQMTHDAVDGQYS